MAVSELKEAKSEMTPVLLTGGRRNILPGQSAWRKRFGFGRTISILLEDGVLQMATVADLGTARRIINATKVYIPGTYDNPEKRSNFITAEIERYLHQYRRLGTRFVLGVGGVETAVRILTLPHIPDRELAAAVYWEGNRQIPFGLDAAYHGYHLIPTDRESDKAERKVLLIAVSRREVHRALDQIRPKIKFDAVYFKLEALGHLLPFVAGFSPEKTYVLFNSRKKYSEISFYRGTRLDFQHISSIGTATIGEAGSGPNAYHEFSEALINEIQNSLDYYTGQFSQSTIDAVYLYGDLSYSGELTTRMMQAFGFQFQSFPIEHWSRKQPNLAEFADQIAVSLDSVAVAMADQRLTDFSPPQERLAADRRRFMKRIIPLAIILMAGMILAWGSLTYQLDTERKWLGQAEFQVSQFAASPSFAMYNQIKQHQAAQRALVEQLLMRTPTLNLSLKELSLLTPRPIRLISYELHRDGAAYKLTLSGEATAQSPPPEVILAEYIARLEGSPFFGKTNLKRFNKKTRDGSPAIEFVVETESIL